MQKSPPEPNDRDEDAGHFRSALARPSLQPAWNWLGDSARFAWALVVLNLRKTLFRLRRGRGRCPCQDPSDSGAAWQTGCEAVAGWHHPARFRRVCPLLGRTPQGAWRCSVDTSDVRPFWGRAWAYLVGLTLGAYFAATLAAFLFLRVVGYPVHYRSVAWPSAWPEIREARARYFFDQAENALKAHRPSEALMSLSQSYQLDPSNYSAGRILAQLWESSGSEYSNQLYRKLMKDHPEQRAATAQAWFGAMLSHGDFASVEALAREGLMDDPNSRNQGAWLNALLFASRRTGDTAAFAPLLQNSALPSYIRQACAWESRLRAASPDEKRRLLTQPLPADAAPYLCYYRIDRLLSAGLADDAWLQLARYRSRLPGADQETLLLRAYAALGWTRPLDAEVDKLLSSGTNAPLVESLSAFLIAHPNPTLAAKVGAAVRQRPLPPGPEQVAAYASLFCAAGAAGDWADMLEFAAQIRLVTGAKLAALDLVGAYFRGETGDAPLERFLPAMSILRPGADYALFEFSDRRRKVQKPARHTAKTVIIAP